jgi:hypothetical protein
MDEINRTIVDKLGPPLTDNEKIYQTNEEATRKVSVITLHKIDQDILTPEFEPYEDSVETNSHETDVDVFEGHEEDDNYITAQVLVPRGEQMQLATVFRRKRDTDGRLIGKYNANPIQDTSEYKVQFSDGTVLEYAANVIAEKLYS